MTVAQLSFRVGDEPVGSIFDATSCGGFFRGCLELEEGRFRQLFSEVIALAGDVDVAEADDYQAKWFQWNQKCKELATLDLRIADKSVESLSIDSAGIIEWQLAEDAPGFQL